MTNRAYWISALLALLSVGCGSSPNAAPRQVTVAAAADLKFAFDELIAEFENQHTDIQVQVIYGSSGNFFAQLLNQAPYDIYFSADIAYPQQLVERGLAVPASQFLYAVGQIVVWVPSTSPIDVEHLGIDAILHPFARKVAIANPRHAPYGRAAQAALQSRGLYDQVKERLVLGENVAQTAQYIESGAADIGIIALSLAMAPAMKEKGRYWIVPLDTYPRMEQGSVILNWAQDPQAAEQFRAFVMGPQGREILGRYGFLLPGE
ncbi:MAG: molybdate ABC transporter substrate-binding protein [Gemmataceae bacterium]